MAAPASYARRSYVGNAAATTVPLGLGASDGSCAVASGTNWPSGSGGDFLVVIDRGQNTEELAWCSGVSGSTLTFAQRGAQGTSGVAHAAGCPIALSMGTQDLDEANQVVAAVLGQSGAAKGDILAMQSAAGPNTLTRVGIGSAGQLLGVSAGLPAWQYPALTSAGGVASSNTTLPTNTPTAVIIGASGATATSSLAAGTWLVTMSSFIQFDATTGAIVTLDIAVGTATATFLGPISAQGNQATATFPDVFLSRTVVAVITGAGSLKLVGTNTGSSNAFAIAIGQTSNGITGYSAVRIA